MTKHKLLRKVLAAVLAAAQIIPFAVVTYANDGVQLASTLKNGLSETWLSGNSNGSITCSEEGTLLECRTEAAARPNVWFATDKINATAGVDISFAFKAEGEGPNTINRYVRLTDSDTISGITPDAYIDLVNIQNNTVLIGDETDSGKTLTAGQEYVMIIHYDTDGCTVYLDGEKLNSEPMQVGGSSTEVDLADARAFFGQTYGRAIGYAKWTLKNLSYTSEKTVELSCDKIQNGILTDIELTSLTVFTGACVDADAEITCTNVPIEVKRYGGIIEISFESALEEGVAYTISVGSSELSFMTLPEDYVPPAIQISLDSSDIFLGDEVEIEAQITEGTEAVETVELYVNDVKKEYTISDGKYYFTPDEAGTFDVCMVVYDAFNVKTQSSAAELTVTERQLPEISISTTAQDVMAGDTIVVSAQASAAYGDVLNVELYVNGTWYGTDDEAPFEFEVTLPEGNNEIYGIVYDDYNTNTSDTLYIDVAEREQPEIKINGLFGNDMISEADLENLVLEFAYGEKITSVNVKIDGTAAQKISDMPYTFKSDVDTFGEHKLEIYAQASDGAYTSIEKTVNVLELTETTTCSTDWDGNELNVPSVAIVEGGLSELVNMEGAHGTVQKIGVADERAGGTRFDAGYLQGNVISDKNAIFEFQFDISHKGEAVGASFMVHTITAWHTLFGFGGNSITLKDGTLPFLEGEWVTIKGRANYFDDTLYIEAIKDGQTYVVKDESFADRDLGGPFRLFSSITAGSNVGDCVYIDNLIMSGKKTGVAAKEVVENTDEYVAINMSDKLSAQNGLDKFVLNSEAGNVVLEKYEVEDNLIKLYPRDGFESGQKHSLTIAKDTYLSDNTTTSKEIRISFVSQRKPFDVISAEYNDNGESFEIVFENNENASKSVTIIVSGFKNGKYTDCSIESITIPANSSKGAVISCPEGDTFKTMLVNSKSELVPLKNLIYKFGEKSNN